LADTTIKVFEVVPPLVDTAMAKDQAGPKIAPEALAQEVLQGIRTDRYEIRVGRTKGLMLLNRLFPTLVESTARSK
jgi:uncharacterized oxidoreductase